MKSLQDPCSLGDFLLLYLLTCLLLGIHPLDRPWERDCFAYMFDPAQPCGNALHAHAKLLHKSAGSCTIWIFRNESSVKEF